ncbi:transcriptional activator FtrA [Vibrio aerogenes CECT 7868]|uniref:Transcriptional activator FtrA n=1 Tax=Vibrio aerogenes CECT 7868 TaxID=1216006 RepID=A0A1M5Y1K7_9VIBR|nr:AraC family transcriptional regulator [Vibrio aerogenes]SHI05950.1 transcriptional activator FtrA [Vibrio aerogenes CECT 7868]
MSLIQWLNQYVAQQDLQDLDGAVETAISGVWFFRSQSGNPRQPMLYQSGILILAQGKKRIHLNQNQVLYGPNDYLVVGVPLPLECEAIAEPGKPILGISIRIAPGVLQKLVHRIESAGYRAGQKACKETCGIRSVAMNAVMEETCIRLVKALCDELDTKVIGQSILEELIYRVLINDEGRVLFELAHKEGYYSRVAAVLNRVHRDYSQHLSVNDLASEANMSVSAFYNAFRSVTLESPVQYIKKVRLSRARELIHLDGRKVNEAARMVGYSSASQFHREYKRLFQETPGEDKYVP